LDIYWMEQQKAAIGTASTWPFSSKMLLMPEILTSTVQFCFSVWP
jgi:hypothetical protein